MTSDPQDLTIIDVETTGLDPKRHEILELAAIRVTPSLIEMACISVRVRPEHIETASPEALAVNGYTPEEWAGALPMTEAWDLVSRLAARSRPVGHNVAFDLGFLPSSSPTGAVWSGSPVCTLALARNRWRTLMSHSLDSVCQHLDIPRPSPHRALDDCRATLEVLRRTGWPSVCYRGRGRGDDCASSTTPGIHGPARARVR